MKAQSFYIKTLGCKVNQVESESVLRELFELGLAPTTELTKADIAIINTCSVTAEADAKTRKAVRKIAAEDSVDRVYVTGCSAVMHHGTLLEISKKVCVLGDKTGISRRIADDFALADSADSSAIDPKFFHTRAFIKVQDGCENFCSYCIVPYARGKSHSLPFDKILSEIKSAQSRNAREIVLTGINIGRYQDSNYGIANLNQLAVAVLETGIDRVRISSIEPPDVTPEFIETLATSERICPHIHLPLQSGSDSVLSRMNRRYTKSEYTQIVSALRAEIPNIALTTDVIVGFPGETNEEFQETVDFCSQMGFSKIHVFKYSIRPGTPAAEMQQLQPQVISERAAILRSLSDKLRTSYIKSFEGSPVEILVERVKDDYIVGTSKEYISYQRPLTETMKGMQVGPGSIVEVIG